MPGKNMSKKEKVNMIMKGASRSGATSFGQLSQAESKSKKAKDKKSSGKVKSMIKEGNPYMKGY